MLDGKKLLILFAWRGEAKQKRMLDVKLNNKTGSDYRLPMQSKNAGKTQ